MTRNHYVHMTGAELRNALDGLNLSHAEFARLVGSRTERVNDWLHDRDRIPQHIRVLCAVWAMPGALAISQAVTNAAIDE